MIRSIVMLVFGSALLLMALRSLRAHRLKEAYVLLLFAVGLPFLALAVWPWGVDAIATGLRVEKPTVMILCLSAFSILMIFKLLSIVSIQDRKIATLTQIVGILMEKQGLARADRAPEHQPRA